MPVHGLQWQIAYSQKICLNIVSSEMLVCSKPSYILLGLVGNGIPNYLSSFSSICASLLSISCSLVLLFFFIKMHLHNYAYYTYERNSYSKGISIFLKQSYYTHICYNDFPSQSFNKLHMLEKSNNLKQNGVLEM